MGGTDLRDVGGKRAEGERGKEKRAAGWRSKRFLAEQKEKAFVLGDAPRV